MKRSADKVETELLSGALFGAIVVIVSYLAKKAQDRKNNRR